MGLSEAALGEDLGGGVGEREKGENRGRDGGKERC